MNLNAAAKALGGERWRDKVRAPGPGHSRNDRSMLVSFDADAPDGFHVHSFAGDDWRECRDHVRAVLGGKIVDRPAVTPIPHRSTQQRAGEIWRESARPTGTLVERYLNRRGCGLTAELALHVVRYHPRLWCSRLERRVPGMVTLLRDIHSNAPCGIQRTFLTPDGEKIDRTSLGRMSGAAIKLSADDLVEEGLHIAEGFESALSAYLAGYRPIWALGSASGIAAFDLFAGVGGLTIMAENDQANETALNACAARWHAAGREVTIVRPRAGNDMNDIWSMVG